MFTALLAGVFFVFWIGCVRRARRSDAEGQRLRRDLADQGRALQKAEHRVQQMLASLEALYERQRASSTPARTPGGRESWKDIADFVVQVTGPLLQMDTVALLRWDPRTSEFRGSAARGLSPQQMNDLKVRRGEGVLGKAAQAGAPLILRDALPASEGRESFLSSPALIFPLQVQSQAQGVLVFCRPLGGALLPDTERLAALLAKHTEQALGNIYLQESTRGLHADLVAALAQAVAAKDPGHREHSDHCRVLVREMAREMQLPEALAEQMELGAMLHDLGRLALPENLLSKDTALTPEEYTLVKKHPRIGYEMLHGIGFLNAVAPIVLHHHEWVNGDGYPEGLAGEEIPLGARLVAIADAWDAMTLDQPYRKALPRSSAMAELRRQAGTQFDPKLVDVFLRLLEKKPLASGAAVAAPKHA